MRHVESHSKHIRSSQLQRQNAMERCRVPEAVQKSCGTGRGAIAVYEFCDHGQARVPLVPVAERLN